MCRCLLDQLHSSRYPGADRSVQLAWLHEPKPKPIPQGYKGVPLVWDRLTRLFRNKFSQFLDIGFKEIGAMLSYSPIFGQFLV